MSETKQILDSIINDFSTEKFNLFFRRKTQGKFREINQSYQQYNDSDFKNGSKLGEAEFGDGKLLVCSFEVQKSLSERSGKKAQYEKAKSILKSAENQVYSAGIFVFFDKSGNFRFSLVYPESIGTRRQWNHFKRFTYFVSQEFTNKTFLQRIGDGDFSTLAKIKEAFSVEKVTEEFYQDIANWYFWAVSHCRFPKDAEAEENGRNIAVIRLITRMIFIWFMRERGLINKDLFEKQQIQDILKNLNNDESSYYTAILQNLFFATLSTKKEERQFGSEIRGHKGYNPDFGNQYVFRYQEMFKNPEKIKDYFSGIPFLNGGLFECLDDKKNGIIIDGFSRTKKNQPAVPNLLFFGAEKKVDLNKAYGTKNKTYKVRGLLDILSSFNFTIDENSPDDADIALDPELLGRVFENLLASFNPETSTTARKATGSYYTPREIVDYMVAESLKAYFKTHLTDIEKIDEKLEQLFSNESSENPFDEKQSKKLVELIESVKIVDPAVGSGAFPMGTLNKLVFILNKVDPGNKLWKEAQLKAADSIPDPSARRMAKERIEEFFEGKNADYGRKLYLIQRCIYGVDIQQIAVEIAKLRFFISLLVDEKIDKEKDNWGIEPLPNLDFKIMQGNSLISKFLGIDFDNGNHKQDQEQAGLLFDQDEDSFIKEFEQKKIDFQNEADKDKKAKLKQEVEDLMIRIFETKVKKQKGDYFRQLEEIESKYSVLPNQKQREEIVAKEKQKLSQKSGFDLENIEKQLREFTSKKKTRPFFPWKLYFAEVFEKGGFDVVIGNPPYVNIEKIDVVIKKSIHKFKTAYQKYDLYVLFYEKSISLLKDKGNLIFISSNKFLSQGYGLLLRQYLLKFQIKTIINFNYNVFESAVVRTCIFHLVKERIIDNKIRIIDVNDKKDKNKFLEEDYGYIDQEVFEKTEENNFRINLTGEKIKLLDKIKKDCLRVEDVCSVNYGLRPVPKEGGRGKKRFIKKNNSTGKYKVYFEGKDMGGWSIKSSYFLDYKPKEMYNPMFKELFENPKIFGLCTLSDINKLRFNYDDTGAYCNHSVAILTPWYLFKDVDYITIKRKISKEKIEISKKYPIKYLQAILNSKLIKFYVNELLYDGTHFYPDHMKSLPIKFIEVQEQELVTGVVDQILAITKSADYLQNPDKQTKVKEYEKQIDELVYKLYELTPEEIKIIENNE